LLIPLFTELGKGTGATFVPVSLSSGTEARKCFMTLELSLPLSRACPLKIGEASAEPIRKNQARKYTRQWHPLGACVANLRGHSLCDARSAP